jgi:glycosyltransferase involved in cell wall biosynthesis
MFSVFAAICLSVSHLLSGGFFARDSMTHRPSTLSSTYTRGNSMPPPISVVIPTLRRPKLLLRALNSVFAQTYSQMDVIVVVDGPDEETIDTLRSISDPRLQVIVNERSLTAAGARNAGVAIAKGEWIAFLDDDDEWLPSKLEKQMAFAQSKGAEFVICLSRVITPLATYVWPETLYDNQVPLDEYLFDRKTAFSGAGFIQTSSYLIKRETFQKSPFRIDTPHDDWDFVLRQSKLFNVRVETVPEVLTILYMEEQRPSLSSSSKWRASLDWLDRVRPMLTRRAYSGFCLGVVGPRAAEERAYPAAFSLLAKAFRHGTPRPQHLAAYLAFWALSQNIRRRLRALLRGETGMSAGARVPPSESGART